MSNQNEPLPETIMSLIELCRAGQCAITIEACTTGAFAKVSASRGHVLLQTSEYLDQNDPAVGEKLENAVKRVQ